MEISLGAVLLALIPLAFGLAIAAIVLTTACKLSGIPQPDFFHAMVVCFVAGMAMITLQFGIGMALAGTSLTRMKDPKHLQQMLMLAAPATLLLTPFLSAGVYSVMLRECSYLKGLLVWVLQMVVMVVLIGGIVAIFYVLQKV